MTDSEVTAFMSEIKRLNGAGDPRTDILPRRQADEGKTA